MSPTGWAEEARSHQSVENSQSSQKPVTVKIDVQSHWIKSKLSCIFRFQAHEGEKGRRGRADESEFNKNDRAAEDFLF